MRKEPVQRGAEEQIIGVLREQEPAVARKLAVILHRIWLDGTEFDPAPAA
jgi:hypothetical protein